MRGDLDTGVVSASAKTDPAWVYWCGGGNCAESSSSFAQVAIFDTLSFDMGAQASTTVSMTLPVAGWANMWFESDAYADVEARAILRLYDVTGSVFPFKVAGTDGGVANSIQANTPSIGITDYASIEFRGVADDAFDDLLSVTFEAQADHVYALMYFMSGGVYGEVASASAGARATGPLQVLLEPDVTVLSASGRLPGTV
ncbi:hypothetical protein [Tropicimonas sp. IMCC34043]|uniref:hypothetical protein n=1 Tax=Tropicimonas sp. IMCC34043 TaxID=2248760 RepID=UPI000E24614E|nr:hypothetical protein [Tropicimonas sp. IMCC34043]